MFRWTMAERPWTARRIDTGSSLPNMTGETSTLFPDGQEEVLAPVLDTSPEFRKELEVLSQDLRFESKRRAMHGRLGVARGRSGETLRSPAPARAKKQFSNSSTGSTPTKPEQIGRITRWAWLSSVSTQA